MGDGPSTDVATPAQTCVLCGDRAIVPFRLGLARCSGCGLVVSPLVWQAGGADALNQEEFDGTSSWVSSVWTRLIDRWNARRTLLRLRIAGVRSGRLLEIGVGRGAVLVAAREAGFDVLGCDLSATVCRRVSDSLRIQMHEGSVATLTATERFRVVVANHVLEHTDNPAGFLKSVCDLLEPGGVLHLAVPNVCSWEASLSGWTSYEPYHMLYFDSSSLTLAVQRAGLRILRIRTYEPFSGWSLTLLRTALGYNRGGKVARPLLNPAFRSRPALVEHSYRVLTLGAGAALWPLRAVQARAGYGEELICLAAK